MAAPFVCDTRLGSQWVQEMDAEALYAQLGRLVETMPDLARHPLDPAANVWLARAYALVEISKDITETILSKQPQTTF